MNPNGLAMSSDAGGLLLGKGPNPYLFNPFAMRPYTIDDSVPLVTNAQTAADTYKMARQLIWGSNGPSTHAVTITAGIASPVDNLPNLARVDLIQYAIHATTKLGKPIDVNCIGYHFVPAAGALARVVFHCPGHACTFNDSESASPVNDGYGDWRTINSLLTAGFDVIAYFMPAYTPAYCGVTEPNWVTPQVGGPHDWLFANLFTNWGSGSAMRVMIEFPLAILDYLKGLHLYTDYSCMGLSGGGWTTVMLAATTSEFYKACAVAGSMPIYARGPASISDSEQEEPIFYSWSGYLDLYTLGGVHSHLMNLYNRFDDCCFGGSTTSQYLPDLVPRTVGKNWDQFLADYTAQISATLITIGAGSFSTVVDDNANHHCITWQMLQNHIVPAFLS